MTGLIIYGIRQNSKNKSINDYLLAGNRMSWKTAMFSIVATETSVLTFISIPGISYRGDWTFLQLAMGYIFGRILVSIILLPQFFKHGITSIYEILEKKFGKSIQKLASATFLITRLLADSVRFLATAIIIQVITGWSITFSILLIAFVTLIYTVFGGLKTVIKVDAMQFIIYIFSGFICIYFLLKQIDMTLIESIIYLKEINKINILDFTGNLFTKPFMFFSAFIGGTMLSFASHGADYMMVQRILSIKKLESAKKAMIGSGIFVFLQFSIFLFIGSLIYLATDCSLLDKDREITYVIKNIIPVGFKGIVVAGVLSAAMSTLSSSINSLSSTTIKDWIPRIVDLKQSKIISVFWTFVLISLSFVFNESSNALVIIGLKIASYTYGCLLSFFILSKFKFKFSTSSIFLSYVYSILTVFYCVKLDIAWTFYILISVIIFISSVFVLKKIEKLIFLRDIFLVNAFFLIVLLFFSNNKIDQSYTKIIDMEIKESCFNDKVWLGYEIMRNYITEFDHIQNVGIVVNQTSSMIDIDNKNKEIYFNLDEFNLKVIFTPEHGLFGEYQAGQKIYTESSNTKYEIPIISLYGNSYKPSKSDIANLDAIFFDIQDIGSRYYTYISTMTYVMEACAENNIPFYILDRPNPLSGKVEGPILNKKYSSFVGMHEIPIRHGMTIGELAYKINEKNWLMHGIKADLYIVKMKGWNRDMYFSDTKLNWIVPSPNIPNNDSAILYSGLCLLEATNLSEGRGTDAPFQIIGAPWLNAAKIINDLNSKNLEGVKFLETSFTPRSIAGKSINPKYLNEDCNGIKIIILDKEKINPLKISLYLLDIINQKHSKELKITSPDFLDKLYGSNDLRMCIESNDDINILMNNWINFNDSKFLLY